MNTLTKILVILLTISSIFLCGIVVTYVANAENYKQLYDDTLQSLQAAERSERDANNDLNQFKAEMDEFTAEKNNEIAGLQQQIDSLENELTSAETARDNALRRVDNWQAMVESFSQTTDAQTSLARQAWEDVNALQQQQVSDQAELLDKSQTILTQFGVIATLTDENRALQEEKTELQNRLDQVLQQYGQVSTTTAAITPVRDFAQVTVPVENIDLNGVISNIDEQNSTAEISRGSTHGVKKDMRFHVFRGDRFICDVVIFEIDADRSVGSLKFVQAPPQIGDKVSTNLLSI